MNALLNLIQLNRSHYRARAEFTMSYDNFISYRNASILLHDYYEPDDDEFFKKKKVEFDQQRLNLSNGIVFW